MALSKIDQVNSKLLLTLRLGRLLYNAVINLIFIMPTKFGFQVSQRKKKLSIQATQNKCMMFCLRLDKMSRISVKESLELNWLNAHNRYLQFIVFDIFKFLQQSVP